MFIQNPKKLNKRGFTLAESVLALAIISIVSVSTLSLILSAQRSTISAAQKQQAQLYAADIISCYRVSENDVDFASNVNFALGKPIDDNTIALSDDLTAHIDQEGKTLKVTIKNGQGSELSTLTFTKGGTQNEEVTQ